MNRTIPAILLIGLFSGGLLSAAASDLEQLSRDHKLTLRRDERRGVTTLMPRGLSPRASLFIYLLKHDADQGLTLRLRINHFAREQLFLKNFLFDVDGIEGNLEVRGTVRTQDLFRTNQPGSESFSEGLSGDGMSQISGAGAGGILEYYDIAMNPDEYELVRKVAAGRKVKLRYVGTRGYRELKVHSSEIKALRAVLAALAAQAAAVE